MFNLTEGAGVRLCDGLRHREALRIGGIGLAYRRNRRLAPPDTRPARWRQIPRCRRDASVTAVPFLALPGPALPPTDKAFTTLIEDLDERGLLEETL
jgi:hypothetical protein